MSIEILPITGIILLVILSNGPTDDTQTSTPPPAPKSFKAYQTRDYINIENPEADYEAILRFIEKRYRRILPKEREEIARNLVEYGSHHKVDPILAAALIARESSFDKNAVSPTGAKGLGQIKDFNHKSLDIKDPFDIQENVNGTVGYLKRMMGIWKNRNNQTSLALASYYKGHGAIKKDKEKIDGQTESYVKDILNNYEVITKIREKIHIIQ